MLKCENLPRTNSTKYETQNIFVKFQQNEHTPALDCAAVLYFMVLTVIWLVGSLARLSGYLCKFVGTVSIQGPFKRNY